MKRGKISPWTSIPTGLCASKACLITGGAKRLGRASALALAKAGADVAITFRNSARDAQQTVVDLSSFGVRAFALHCDITNEASVKSMMKEAGRELGRIDILVNNAANYDNRRVRAPHPAPMGCDVRLEHARTVPGLARSPEVDAPKAARIEAPDSQRAKKIEAKIIHMGSLGGLRPWATHAHYCSSKAALHMLTKVMAKALAPEIAVNAVAPGMIDLGEKAAKAAFYETHGQANPHATQWHAAKKLPPPFSSSPPRRNS